mmetsp:Transcript_24205/g.55159  ORF Transcript_24205/g.55159 Transcript_24205/m.55159 type:complete len:311 (-) Transcript_24205:60-992(-)
MPSSSFCLCSNSSTSAVWFASSHEMVLSTLLNAEVRSASGTLPLILSSVSVCFIEYVYDSSAFFLPMRWVCASSSALNLSASSTIRWMSASDRRPLSFLIVIFSTLFVALSTADTLRIPLASTSKVTSICGTPRGAGAMPLSWKRPSLLLSFVMARSPSKTWISTPGWLSWYVLNVCVCFVGTVVPRLMSAVMTPPAVSRPKLSGATSSTNKSATPESLSPLGSRMAACTAAPYATASSGLISLASALPLKKSCNSFCTFGMRVEPPTKTMSSILPLSIWASRSARSTGSSVPLNRSAQSSSNRARVMFV